MRTRVKICGITRAEDAVAAAHCGADAIGLVFYPKSARYVDIEQAHGIMAVLPPFVTRVGLFVNPDNAQVEAVLQALALDLLQFHGEEDAEFCRSFGRPYIKAVRMREGTDLPAMEQQYASASALLLDSYHAQQAGGSGESFNWNRVPSGLSKPIILAGGLSAANVAMAIATVQPYAVDVSSGVESSPAIKDVDLIAAFIREVNKTQ